MSKFVINHQEARMLAKMHFEECQKCIATARQWKNNPKLPNHLGGYADYLKYAKEHAARAKYWYKKLGVPFGTAALQSAEPPKDGRYIFAIGQIISKDEMSTCVDPFREYMRWSAEPGQFAGWHFTNGLSVASCLEDEIKIFHWRESRPSL